MMNKILLDLAVVLTISTLGSALKCDVCAYTSIMPAAKRVCTTIDCPVGNCYKLTYTAADGSDIVETGCDVLNYCSDINKECTDRTKQLRLKSCQSSCCNKTDNCNGGVKDRIVPVSFPPPTPSRKTQVTNKEGKNGGGLICNKCTYSTKYPEDQKCDDDSTESCSTGYCKTESYTLKDGTKVVSRGCAKDNDPCPKGYDSTCDVLQKLGGVKSCAGACCNTNKCNNFTPSSATGITATKFTLVVMIVAGYLVV